MKTIEGAFSFENFISHLYSIDLNPLSEVNITEDLPLLYLNRQRTCIDFIQGGGPPMPGNVQHWRAPDFADLRPGEHGLHLRHGPPTHLVPVRERRQQARSD